MTQERFGLLGNLRAQPGKRDELIALLKDGSGEVPGKLVYLMQLDRSDPDLLWITEVWETQQAYDDCLTMPQVAGNAARYRALVAGSDLRVETTPIDV